MENTKVDVGREESQNKGRELKRNASSNNNIKYILVTGIKGEKLKKLIFERTKSDTKSPPLAQYKLALIVAAIMLLLWACAVQLTSFQADQAIASIARKFQPTTTTSLISFPIERVYTSKGYLMVSSNGGLNQMRTGVVPRFKRYKVVHLTKTDARLANNGLSPRVQKLRCRAMYDALRFTAPIEELGKKIVAILKGKGPFLALHLRYEMDMLAFSGCTEGCTPQEAQNLTDMRYAYPWWKEKEIDSEKKRQAGLCPLTPEETALVLRALEIDSTMQIYIAAGDIYGGERRMAALRESYPNLVKKETLLAASDIEPFQNHSNQMAALDYIVSLESDIFMPTFGGHMAQVVEGHRRYLGYKVTINLDKLAVVSLIDKYRNGTLSWDKFSESMKEAHENRMGGPTKRLKIPGKPKEEDYFYINPQECLPPFVASSNTTINTSSDNTTNSKGQVVL
ncbi:hypothetical protein LWI29_027068 [Acer saccharum]|uniref:O-fucosyltransferase family protein n=1 Tax=Acer saccharum TaxID=4024 RepID=A0AA39RJ69_ACESA|nr:hypothetical protein LWI29_027068 [Acer saccharum]